MQKTPRLCTQREASDNARGAVDHDGDPPELDFAGLRNKIACPLYGFCLSCHSGSGGDDSW